MTGPSPADNASAIVARFLEHRVQGQRQLIAVAGPPAAGKSTVATLVCEQLEAAGVTAGSVPMDGFHMDNPELEALGLLDRKGAPETFDLEQFSGVLERLKARETMHVPLFDRARDCTVPEALEISGAIECVVVEGNYLLFDASGWRDLARLWDFSVFFHIDLEELETRLTHRWISHGFEEHEARTRARRNDIPNAKRVLAQRLPVDLTL